MRFALILCLLAPVLAAASPYRQPAAWDVRQPVNRALFRHWVEQGVVPTETASDAVFLRRVALTLAGRLPTAKEVREFLADKKPGKRAAVVEKFLRSPEYADMQAMRFADMLRIKSEFPINLWPNAVQLWHRRLHDELDADRPLNEMFFEMLTVSGSNFRVPHANFFRASADRTPSGLAAMTMLTCLGMRPERFTAKEREGLAALFSRIRFKSTHEWKEQIVYTDYNPARVEALLPDGTKTVIAAPETDPRRVFADWLVGPGEPLFCRAMTNRVWHWVFGRGIYPVADDLPRSAAEGANAPFSPELQELLNDEFRKHGYSLRHLYRVILNCAAFQVPSPAADESGRDFSSYPVRRLEAEVLVDALAGVFDRYDKYMSVIPEPFTFLPPQSRAVTIADGSISTGVLDNFGRPPRDSGTLGERNGASSESQNLYLMNSAALFYRINQYSKRLNRAFRNERDQLDRLYLDLLSRYPTIQERQIFRDYRKALNGSGRVWVDTIWALINGKEFLFHH